MAVFYSVLEFLCLLIIMVTVPFLLILYIAFSVFIDAITSYFLISIIDFIAIIILLSNWALFYLLFLCLHPPYVAFLVYISASTIVSYLLFFSLSSDTLFLPPVSALAHTVHTHSQPSSLVQCDCAGRRHKVLTKFSLLHLCKHFCRCTVSSHPLIHEQPTSIKFSIWFFWLSKF